MVLKENDYQEKINSLTEKDWSPLIELIPIIESTTDFQILAGKRKITARVIQEPYYTEASIVAKFREIVCEIPIIIDFNWGAWDEGRIMARDITFDFDTIDIPTKCKLITAIVRNDRFCEGALADAFKSGLILRLLRSIENQVVQYKSETLIRNAQKIDLDQKSTYRLS